jgi:O-antigen ligase
MPFRILILLVFEVCAAIGSAVFPYWGFLLLMLLTYTRLMDDRPNAQVLHIPLVITAAVIVGTVVRLASVSGRLRLVWKECWLFLVLLLWMIVATAATSFTPESVLQIDETFSVSIVTALMILWLRSDNYFLGFAATFLLSGLYYVKAAFLGGNVLREHIGEEQFDRLSFRNVSNFGNPNFLAILMTLVIFVALALLYTKRAWFIRLLLLGCVAAYLYVFLRCQSRGGTLAFGVALILFWILQPKKILAAAITVLVLVIGLLVLTPDSFINRLSTVSSYEDDASATNRLELWGIATDLIKRNPVFGVGPNNFLRYAYNSQHNAYLQTASELGIPGLLLYLAILGSGFRSGLLARKFSKRCNNTLLLNLTNGSIAGLTAIVVQGFFTGFAFREFVYIHITLLYGLRLASEEQATTSRTESLAPVPR